MSNLFISPGYVASLSTPVEPHWPAVLWDSLVRHDNVAAGSEDPDHPASNLANASTYQRWQSLSDDVQTLTIGPLEAPGPIDCIAWQGANFGSTGRSVSIEGLTAEPGATYEELVPATMFADDSPAMFLVPRSYLTHVRITISAAEGLPRMGVLFIGRSLRIQPGIQPGYVPIADALEVERVPGISQGGDYLGAIVTHERRRTSAQIDYMPGDWFRQEMRPFVQAANRGRTFFWWAQPDDAPDEVAYCWFDGATARASVATVMGERSITLPIAAVAH